MARRSAVSLGPDVRAPFTDNCRRQAGQSAEAAALPVSCRTGEAVTCRQIAAPSRLPLRLPSALTPAPDPGRTRPTPLPGRRQQIHTRPFLQARSTPMEALTGSREITHAHGAHRPTETHSAGERTRRLERVGHCLNVFVGRADSWQYGTQFLISSCSWIGLTTYMTPT